MEYLGLQTHHANVRQWGRVPSRDLERRIAILRKRLFDTEGRIRVVPDPKGDPAEDSTAYFGARPSLRPNSEWSAEAESDFTPYTQWQPDPGFGEWTPESEREREAHQPSPTEANYFSLEHELGQLEEYLGTHERGDATARVDSVFRRIAVERFMKAGHFKKHLDNVGVLPPMQQQLTLELWMHQTTRSNPSPAPNGLNDFARYAEVVNMETDAALRYLASLDLNRRRDNESALERTFQEIVDSLSAGRGDYSPDSFVAALREFRESRQPYPIETFGKLLHYFLGHHDDLTIIRDAETLHNFLVAHQD